MLGWSRRIGAIAPRARTGGSVGRFGLVLVRVVVVVGCARRRLGGGELPDLPPHPATATVRRQDGQLALAWRSVAFFSWAGLLRSSLEGSGAPPYQAFGDAGRSRTLDRGLDRRS